MRWAFELKIDAARWCISNDGGKSWYVKRLGQKFDFEVKKIEKYCSIIQWKDVNFLIERHSIVYLPKCLNNNIWQAFLPRLNHIHLRMHSRREKAFKEGRGIVGGKLQKSAQTDRHELWFNIRLCRSKSVSICEAFKELNHMLSHLNRTCTFKYLKQPTFWVWGGIQGEKRQEEAFKGGNWSEQKIDILTMQFNSIGSEVAGKGC